VKPAKAFANCSRQDGVGFVLAKSLLQRMPLVDFLDGVGEIEGWIHQQVLLDADRSLLGIDHAQMSAFKGAQACPEEVDSQNLDVTRDRDSGSRRPRESCMKGIS
jgi:hypothetical protein